MAAYIAWKDFYSVHDAALDAEHKHILECINELYAAIDGPTDALATRHVLERLVDHTHEHFDHEEQVLRAAGFPNFEAHRAQHEAMREQTVALRTHLTQLTARDVLLFLKTWWLDHIQHNDKEYAAYLEKCRELSR